MAQQVLLKPFIRVWNGFEDRRDAKRHRLLCMPKLQAMRSVCLRIASKTKLFFGTILPKWCVPQPSFCLHVLQPLSVSCKQQWDFRPQQRMVQAFAMELQHAQLASHTGSLCSFCAIVGASKPMRRKTFTAVTKRCLLLPKTSHEQRSDGRHGKVHRYSHNVRWNMGKKRGHKSHDVGTAISVAMGLCLDFEVLSICSPRCGMYKALEKRILAGP